MSDQERVIINDLLFQKLGNKWYIFSEIEDEVIYSAMPEGMDPRSTKLELYQVIEEHMSNVASHQLRIKDIEAA